MERSGYGIAKDVKKQTSEDGKFPIICESCLGDNPYVRMVRDISGKECKICSRPYNSFRWKPGPKARFKQTIVCQSCARLKNVCQTCLFDLEYGLPVQVRDKFLEQQQKLELPDSHVNANYMASNMDKMLDNLPYGKSPAAHEELKRLTRSQPYYKRNRPRVCTFWLRGACNRGEECPFLHEEDVHDPQLADQNIRDRFIGQDDPVARKILRRATDAASEQDNNPEDNSVTTLYVGGVTASINEKILNDTFSTYGELWSVKMVPRQNCAFVTFASRQSAEKAMAEKGQNLVLYGERLHLTWGRRNPAAQTGLQKDGVDMLESGKYTTGGTYPSTSVQGLHPNGYGMPQLPPYRLPDNAIPTTGHRDGHSVSDYRRVMYASMNPAEAEHRK